MHFIKCRLSVSISTSQLRTNYKLNTKGIEQVTGIAAGESYAKAKIGADSV
jgi:hypothetical protein